MWSKAKRFLWPDLSMVLSLPHPDNEAVDEGALVSYPVPAECAEYGLVHSRRVD